MSKRCHKVHLVSNSANDGVKSSQKTLLNSAIGFTNVKRWNEVKCALSCKTNEEFVKLLLDIADEHIQRNNIKGTQEVRNNNELPKLQRRNKHKNKIKNNDEEATEENHVNVCNTDSSLLVSAEKLSSPKESATDLRLELNDAKINKNEVVPINVEIKPLQTTKSKLARNKNRKRNDASKHSDKLHRKQKKNHVKKRTEIDIRKAPEFNKQDAVENINSVKSETNERVVAVKIKLCNTCCTRHVQDRCPLQNPEHVILDSCCYDEWEKKFAGSGDEQDTKNEGGTFAYESLPESLCLDETNTSHGVGVFAKTDFNEFTQFGPVVGKIVKEVDVPEDCSMQHLWDVISENMHVYVNTEDELDSNWTRFIRPAPVRETKNLLAISKNNEILFVTTKKISVGEELLYWQDDVVASNKKKMEKTSCGGCNMNFTHPIYYRIHCSIFHDVRYSLTIRKYHCKICGAAVLGKENIMKHAAELHNGQGAYQCQFCKKFFLRLNYLEMHRTYGCSANPHRSRPLCDFCGRKFCQPQKLKVHIKRMHSDMSEVLKEFQCKNCLKILGSRAALQRHLKEVHQKHIDGACACSRCGKMFQNKSNLKIHMLTHSGVKPFKCAEKNCMAAFTTKQCLQFHYKKVHGLSEDLMPKIERSVDYTFEAYSGQEDQDGNFIHTKVEMSSQRNDSFKYTSETDESLDCKNLDDPPALHSPIPIETNELSSSSNPSPPTLEAYAPNMKILSKGSKKWIGDEPLQRFKTEIYQASGSSKNSRHSKTEEPPTTDVTLDVDESQTYEHPKLPSNLNIFNRHESSNASLLVEAALDSVCSEPNIDIDVNSTTNCTDALVNNLYTLSHLPDVTYSHSVDMSDTRDINLISPSVNDHISVTDDMNDDLRHNQNIGLDYSSFHQEDFSPPNSPARNNFVRDYINVVSPQNYETSRSKNVSPIASPPRYDFAGHNVSSDDSNGIGVQNLSINNTKDSIQLDLSVYKSHNVDFQMRKDFRIKFDSDVDRKQVYILDVDNLSKSYGDAEASEQHQSDNIESSELKTLDIVNMKHNKDVEPLMRPPDIRNKFDLDLDLRVKTYDNVDSDIRNRNSYDGTIDDFRIKNYDLIENLETRTNLDGRSLLESDFRPDRSFEHLVLNSSELQGLDMSARSYHNYSNLNRYHHLYSDVDRTSVDLRLNYSPPPPPTYTHSDILRVVSLDLTPPGGHSVDLSLRSHHHNLQSNRLALDQTRLLTSDLSAARHLNPDTRLISDMSSRILSDHTTNRLITADQRLISDIPEQSRLLDGRIIGNGGTISPVPYAGYSVSPGPYHPTTLPPRPHVTSPNPAAYHHYSAYY